MSEQNEPLKSDQQEKIQSEPVKIETENIFDPELIGRPGPEFFEEMDAFMDNPMAAIIKPLTQYFEAIRPREPKPIKSEHKVRIYQFDKEYNLELLERFAAEIEDLLNDGYCCHIPTVVNDYMIMDFSRRKEENDAE